MWATLLLFAQIVVVGYAEVPPSGVIVSASSHDVVLTWTASGSSGVLGYNIYRGTVSGGPYNKIGSHKKTAFTDINVQNGATYYYVVTSFTSTRESVYSNEASATIPSNGPPVITQQPQSVSVNVGQTATFNVTATGATGYQWNKNSSAISGATNPSYTTPATTQGDNGSLFNVVVSNSFGNVTSNNATLTVTSSGGTQIRGNQSQSSFDSNNANWVEFTPFTTANGSAGYTVNSISIYVGNPQNAAWGVALYNMATDGSGKPVGGPLCSTMKSGAPVSGWNTVTVTGCPTLTASTSYQLAQITGSGSQQQGEVMTAPCPNSTFGSFFTTAALGSTQFPNPVPATGTGNFCYSEYITLTCVGACGN